MGIEGKLSQHAKRPPAQGQRAFAVSRDGSAFRQVVEEPGLERLQRTLLPAEEIRLRLAFALTIYPSSRRDSEFGVDPGCTRAIRAFHVDDYEILS